MPTRKFLDYERPLDHFTKFGMEYAKIGSIWPWHPLNLEIDGLFNYLYHHAIGYPSQIYAQKHTRALTSQERRSEMKKWIKEYKQWNSSSNQEEDIEFRLRNSKIIKKLLSPKCIMDLTGEEVETALLATNSIQSDRRNLSMIMKKNTLHAKIKIVMIRGKGYKLEISS